MNVVEMIIQQFSRMQWTDYLDIIAVAYLLYIFLPLLRSSGSLRIVGVILGIMVVTWITDILEMHALNFILTQLLAVGLIAVVVLFQPEIRRMLAHLGSVRLKRFLGAEKQEQEMFSVISQTVSACEHMSRERVGALIVFERDSHLDEYFKTGTVIDGKLSDPMIRNLFFPKAALHDGAIIVKDGRIAAAACVLPLSNSSRLSADLGTRHRAGVGLSEITDAVVVIVSEETGAISVAVGGILKRYLAPQTLEKLLRHELCKSETKEDEGIVVKLRQKLQKKGKEDGKK
ncbi:MAG: TIGR00159 family protein [Ruminococcaceae bacterium]|nr:TIGR00159 family protein [Oscillospiraceae bacterium]